MAVCHNWAIFESSLCKISYTSGPNVCWLFRQFWKHLLSCINFWGNFWKILGYFIFQNLFTLVFKYTLGQNEHNFIIKNPFFGGGNLVSHTKYLIGLKQKMCVSITMYTTQDKKWFASHGMTKSFTILWNILAALIPLPIFLKGIVPSLFSFIFIFFYWVNITLKGVGRPVWAESL